MEEDVVHGDKRAAVVLAALVLSALALLLVGRAIGLDRPDVLNADEGITRAGIILSLGCVVKFGFAAYFETVAFRTITARVWPPPRMKVPWTIRRKRGSEAIVMGTACAIVGVLFLAQLVASISALLKLVS